MHRLFIPTLLALSLTTPVSAQEEDANARAREAFDRAQAHFEAGRFVEAERGFYESRSLLPPDAPNRSLLLFNMATAIRRQGGRDADELQTLQQFVSEAEQLAPAALLMRARARILELGGDPGGEAGEDDVERVRPEASSASGADATEETMSPIGPIVLAGGGVVLVTGLVLGGVALARDGDLTSMCTDGVCPDTADNRATLDEIETLSAVSDALWVTGAVVAAVGLVLTLVLRDRHDVASAGCGLGAGCEVARW